MITIIVNLKVKQDKKVDFMKIMKELIDKSNEEEGCISYDLYENNDDSNSLVLIENWISEDAIDIHNKSLHFTSMIPKIKEMASIDINIYSKFTELFN